MRANLRHTTLALCLAAGLAGCASNQPAPVVERGNNNVDARVETYTVQRYDTLYSIALEHGVDWQDLARWNGITDPGKLTTGQRLRVRPPQGAASASGSYSDGAVQVTPIAVTPAIEARPLEGAATGSAATPGAGGMLKTEPKALKLPYSEQNLAAVQRAGTPVAPTATAPVATAPATPSAPATPAAVPAASGTETSATDTVSTAAVANVAGINWSWPNGGPVLAKFAESGSKGVQIGGRLGDPVLASAAGKVTYVGDGVRGYGNLVIVKHNDEYLSVYAHNRKILVQSGQMVSKGQKIAEMGNSGGDKPLLHFEIRRFGKPVDPLEFLPPRSG